jgi:hypothetical protein
VEAVYQAGEILKDPMKLARLTLDIGDNGEINDPEFRPIFAALADRVPEAVRR